jgi:hypothetical protein
MSRSKRIFGLIKKELPGVELCKDMLVVLPTEHILRGFLIEATMEKGRVYLWRTVAPLHRPMRSVFLDYSTRISANGQDIYIDEKAYKESAAAIRTIIEGHIEYLQQVRSPRDFLRHIEPMVGSRTSNVRFDLALTYLRIGQVRKSKDILRVLDIEVDQLDENLRLPVHSLVKRIAREIEVDPDGLIAQLDNWENSNVETLGLQKSRPSNAATSLAC